MKEDHWLIKLATHMNANFLPIANDAAKRIDRHFSGERRAIRNCSYSLPRSLVINGKNECQANVINLGPVCLFFFIGWMGSVNLLLIQKRKEQTLISGNLLIISKFFSFFVLCNIHFLKIHMSKIIYKAQIRVK